MFSRAAAKSRISKNFSSLFRKQFHPKTLVKVPTAQFSLLDDKFKQLREQAFNRIKHSKGDTEETKEEKKPNFFERTNLFSGKSSSLTDYHVSGLNLDQTIDQLKQAIEQKESSHDLYYKILERLQEIIIDEPETTGKKEYLRILRALNYYRPKDEEQIARQARDKGHVTNK
jgi:hypothetical protein